MKLQIELAGLIECGKYYYNSKYSENIFSI